MSFSSLLHRGFMLALIPAIVLTSVDAFSSHTAFLNSPVFWTADAIPPRALVAFTPPRNTSASKLRRRVAIISGVVIVGGIAWIGIHPPVVPAIAAGFSIFPFYERGSRRWLKPVGILTAGVAVGWSAVVGTALWYAPREMWSQRWPAFLFQSIYQWALDTHVEIEGMENLPRDQAFILAGNHISKSAMDAALMASKIVTQLHHVPKIVATDAPPIKSLRWLDHILGEKNGMLLLVPSQASLAGATHGVTEKMVEFLLHPQEEKRGQAILIIFPAGTASGTWKEQYEQRWRRGTAIAALAADVAIIPFYIEGLPLWWSPVKIVTETAAHLLANDPPFHLTIRFGKPVPPLGPAEELIEVVRQRSIALSGHLNGAA